VIPQGEIKMIETNQGIAKSGRVFGYDHTRCNFIEWDLTNSTSCITVAVVQNDSEEEEHGSLAATRRDAMKIAAEQNRKEYSSLRAAIVGQGNMV
jgi:hypothetical protein